MSIEKLSASKRFEIHFLESVQAPGLVSCISMELYPNSSKIKEQSLNPGFHNSLLPYLVYHTQLLLEEYTKLNAFYLEDCIHYHENINIGIAIDNGKGLRVIYLNTKKSDSIIDIQKAIVKASIDYDNDKLTNDQLTKSTFTITDLSNFKLSGVYPLINKNQSCILGITKSNKKYQINCSFDHRVLEGYYVSNFLNDLNDNLLNDKIINNEETNINEDISEMICNKCFKTVQEDQNMNGPGLLQIKTSDGNYFICRNCFIGY